MREIECPRRRPRRGSGGQSQVGENLGNYPGIFDGGDDRHGTATVRTVCQEEIEVGNFVRGTT